MHGRGAATAQLGTPSWIPALIDGHPYGGRATSRTIRLHHPCPS
ncbi:hypothetical protein BIFGAL_02556 [Bifidobacterium gallicum DSM 20093 = LMG 11596]|uniref:Uncharacterized protein n=1 Tax=Bifidobacterium gallicum DSM 20093 = LMG 11596 TaxID=561180 RepID=D1NS02_9BIFI|nr:hypothetical protein BIFGAL_02556 [Bifidobacterium gallicum DSM 20093 = LMG 11596]